MSDKTTDTIPYTGINEEEVDMKIVNKNSHHECIVEAHKEESSASNCRRTNNFGKYFTKI